MKHLRYISCLLALCMLAGCGSETELPTSSLTAENTTTIITETETDVTDNTVTTQTALTTETTTDITTSITTAPQQQSTTQKITVPPSAVTNAPIVTAPPPAVTAPPRATAPPQQQGTLSGSRTLEVFEKITLGDFCSVPGAVLEQPNTKLDTGSIGNKELRVVYQKDGKRCEQTLCYTVADTTKPILLNGGYKTTILRGTAFDLTTHVGFADNYDRAPRLTYSGSVDTNTLGSYPLTAVATDSSGNRLEWQLTVKVADALPTYVNNTPILPFADFAAQYGGANKALGIDVSKWQGEIDFQAVKKAGCSFVIMRMGHSRNGIEMDEYYQANMAGAKKAGLKVGVYFYSTANTEKDVRAQASWILKQLNGQKLDFPVAFDWESFTNFQKYGMSIHDLNSLFYAFANEIEKGGYSAMLYSSKNILVDFWEKQTSYPVWLAHYTNKTDYTGNYAIWQKSCRGQIPGIAGDVDLNIWYTDRSSF